MAYEHVINTLNKVRRYQKNALAKGLRMREETHKAIEAGEDIINYRTEWLKDSVIKVFKLLEQCSKEFNNQHMDDRISSLDLVDVLSSSISTMELTIEKMKD